MMTVPQTGDAPDNTRANENDAIIECFAISGQAGYSEFWRCNRSSVEIHEMAQLLGALRKAASYVGGNVGRIVWSGMAADNAITLDPSLAMGRYPVPAEKVDRLVGHTIRKAYMKTEWTDRLKNLAMARAKLPVRYAYKFQLFYNMAERVYLDCLSNRSPLGHYTSLDRDQKIAKALTDAAHPPTIAELLHLWWEMAADPKGKKYKQAYRDKSVRGLSKRTSLEKFYGEPLLLLNSIVDPLSHACPKIHGVSERVNYRMDLYFSIWPQLFEHIKHWASDAKDPYLQNSRTQAFSKGLGDDELKNELPLWFGDAVEKLSAKQSQDLTGRVREVVPLPDDVVTIKENHIVMPARSCVRKKLLHSLKIVIKSVAQKKTRFNRGLCTGKIDRRRLYRAATTGTIFQMASSRFELVNDIVMLVDATGSMASPNKWEKAEAIYQTLFTAIHAYNPSARLFAYNEMKSVCRITELFLKDTFYTILPHGKTASGEALIAVAKYFTGQRKKPFIIHLTDGASNWGCGVAHAIRHCHRSGINLLTLGMNCDADNKTMLREEYGDLVQFVDATDTLPYLFRDLLSKSKWM